MLLIITGLLIITTGVIDCHAEAPKFKLEGRIVDGNDVSIKDVPYQVSVRFLRQHRCGGSIISKRVVISSYHAFDYPLFASSYSIQYGTSDISGNENIITAKRILGKSISERSGFDNDIAIVYLVSDIIFSEVAQPIPLASIAPAVGTYANISGWGFESENGTTVKNLKMATIQIIDISICQQQYKDLTEINEKMLCAGVVGGGKDACKKDSGGPLASNGQLIGIISFGIGCGRADHYGVYTNIAAHKDWIEERIQNIHKYLF